MSILHEDENIREEKNSCLEKVDGVLKLNLKTKVWLIVNPLPLD